MSGIWRLTEAVGVVINWPSLGGIWELRRRRPVARSIASAKADREAPMLVAYFFPRPARDSMLG